MIISSLVNTFLWRIIMDNLIYIALIILCGLYIHLWMNQAKINIELEVNKEFRKLFSESSCTHADAIMKSHNQIKALNEVSIKLHNRINNLSDIALQTIAKIERLENK